MASNENEKLLDEILKSTSKNAEKRPAEPAQKRESSRPAASQPVRKAAAPQPEHSAPEREVHNSQNEGRRMTKAEREREAKRRKKRRRNKSVGRVYGVLIMLTIIIVTSIALSVSIIAVGKDMLGIEGTETLHPFTIPEGATTAEIAEDLYEAGIIKYPKAFVYFSRLSDADAGYKAGEHEVSSAMAYEALISELSGLATEELVTVDVMFPEGTSLYDAARKLEDAGVCESQKFIYNFNRANYGYEFEEYLPKTQSKLKFAKMEGYLFPDTYTFYEGMEPADVCRKIYMNFNKKITDEHYKRMEELGISLDEMITLASIVQAEAANKSVMKDVASVFWNRLNDPANFTRLQSDPTTKYVEKVIKPNIDLEDELIYEAYDTYICTGLPAGAIGNPGMDAIEAVLYPNETNYYYFYANVDTGVTYFATTLEEHYANEEMIKQQQAEAAAQGDE